MSFNLTRLAAVCAAAGVVGLGVTTLASALDFSDDNAKNGCRITGYLRVHDDKTSWELRVVDMRGDGAGAYAKVVIDREGKDDEEFRSSKTDGQYDTVSFSGEKNYSGTQHATLYACEEPDDGDGDDSDSDDCTQVARVDER